MKSLLQAGFADSYMMLIILVVVIVAFLLLTLSRKKKEENYRNDLNSKIVPGAHVKTFAGLYGKVVSIKETTDGKIVLIESGEGEKVSYYEISIDGIFAIDTKKDVVYDENGNDITFKDEEESENVDVVEFDEEEDEDEEDETEEDDEVEVEVEEVKEKPKKKTTAKKPTKKAKTETK